LLLQQADEVQQAAEGWTQTRLKIAGTPAQLMASNRTHAWYLARILLRHVISVATPNSNRANRDDRDAETVETIETLETIETS
jgi:hypothetical protein